MKNKLQNNNKHTGGRIYVWQKTMLNFKPLIFAVMCVFALSACETTSTPPAVGYPITASYDNTFLKDHSRQSKSNDNPANNPFIFTLLVASSLFMIASIARLVYVVNSGNQQ